MRYEFKPSFERSTKALSPEAKAEIKAACLAFLDLLELRARLPIGVGLKHLDDDYWEIRKGLRYRIIFRWRRDSIEFILAGSHASIKNFLKNNGEVPPSPVSNKHYSGKFVVRIPPEVHRALAIKAAEEGVSLNRLVSAKLCI